jgi:Caspase domain
LIRFATSLAFFLSLVGVLLLPSAARAANSPARLVLIVANNRGTDLGRADLHYADDDGAKYRALFRSIVDVPADVQLLTRFDRDTARLFGDAPDALPTRAAIAEKAARLAARRAELALAGREVELVFVYAGHGDVESGKGFVQLEDGAFAADDLAALVRRIDATRTHVILDSCNSVFLVSPRKPGGRHVTTSDDAVRAIRERLPRVGVFLSTSADGEVFEWSELGAGIFSHAVRSGLSGAADANGDGEVSYAELRAFVDVATQSVKNPRYRPKVFARGPDGVDGVALYSPRASRDRRLTLEGPVRATIRDGNDIPWIDVHLEAQVRVELALPPPLDDARATKETLDLSSGIPRVVRRELLTGGAEDDARIAARGAGELFRDLFATPFGPRAMAHARVEDGAEPAQSYGVSRDDVARFATLLRQSAHTERARRHVGGLVIGGVGLVSASMGTLLVARNGDDTSTRALGTSYLVTGGALLLISPFVAFKPGAAERIYEDFESDLAKRIPTEQAIASAEKRLFELEREERTYRHIGAVALGVGALALAGTFTLNELRDQPDTFIRGTTGATALLAAGAALSFLQPTTIERLAEVWRQEPSRNTARLSIGAFGAGLSLSGTF